MTYEKEFKVLKERGIVSGDNSGQRVTKVVIKKIVINNEEI